MYINKFEIQLLELLNRSEKFVNLLEAKSDAAEKAKEMGLKSLGFGRWGKDADGPASHKTIDGELVPVPEKDAGGKKKATGKKSADGEDASPEEKTPRKKTPTKPDDPGQARAQQAMPKAQLSGKPLSTVPRKQLQQVATRIDDLARMGREAKEKGEKAPNFNLCDVSIPGTNLYCGGHKGIVRDDMPQFKGTPRPGSEADKLPKDREGNADVEEFFKKMLEKDGVSVSEPTSVPADRLKSTQSELVGVKVAAMSALLADKNNPAYDNITAPIYVSRDGYVLDGHHRWAAIVSHNAKNPAGSIEMQVRVIDEDIEPLVKRSNQFAEEIGIRAKAADTDAAGDGKPPKSA